MHCHREETIEREEEMLLDLWKPAHSLNPLWPFTKPKFCYQLAFH